MSFFYRIISLVVFLVGFSLFAPRMAPHISAGDSAELALAGETLGIAHSPGYTPFVIVNHMASRLILSGNKAYRQNSGSNIFIMMGLVMIGIFLKIILGSPFLLAFPLVFLFSPGIQASALVVEVFPLTFFWLALMSVFLVRYQRSQNLMALMGLIMGLGIWVHQTLLFTYPAIILFLWMDKKRKIFYRKLPLMLIFGIIATFLLLFIPLRSWMNPVLDWEDPQTLKRFIDLILRARYGFLQLAQGQGGVSFAPASIFYSFKFILDMMVQNIGWVGLFIVTVGSIISLDHSRVRKVMILCWTLIFISGPFFIWMTQGVSRPAPEVIERFILLPLFGFFILFGIGFSWLANHKDRIYRIFCFSLCFLFLFEKSLHKNLHAMQESFTSFKPQSKISMRYDKSAREAGLNAMRNLPAASLLFMDRADELEFVIGYLLGAEKRRSQVKFVDCNAGITKSIYGNEYYRIWGKPRLDIRTDVESKMIAESKLPVYYATFDPNMVDIFRTREGFLFKTWVHPEDSGKLEKFQWNQIFSFSSWPKEVRAQNFVKVNSQMIAQSLFDNEHFSSAEIYYGIGQFLQGSHRYEQLGYWSQVRGDTEKAQKYYFKALSAGNKSESLFANLSLIQGESHGIIEGQSFCSFGLQFFPHSSQILMNQAIFDWKLGNWDNVVKSLSQVILRDPRNIEAIRLISEARKRLSQ
ncbi:MAG: protein O-mannosyl-transferase family [Elusimicrobiota bacterium]